MAPDRDTVYTLAPVAVLTGVFSLLSYVFWGYTIDDAYITLRYSENLAETGQIAWNVGADPVEGFTSFSWMLIGTIPHALGFPPVLFVKLVSAAAALGAAIGVYYYGVKRGADPLWAGVVAAQIAASPAIVFLSTQAMETAFAMLLILVVSVGLIELIESYDRRTAVVMYGVMLLSLLTRPGLVLFSVVALAVLAVIYLYRGRHAELRSMVALGFVLVFVPGLVYMAARYSYFGYLFPNPFYAKSTGGTVDPGSVRLVFRFTTLLLAPVALLSALNAYRNDVTYRDVEPVLPVLVGSGAFLFMLLFIKPWQGYLYRFQAPVLAGLLASTFVFTSFDLDLELSLERKTLVRTAMILLLISGLFVYPFHNFRASDVVQEQYASYDRERAGMALGDLDGEYSMFVTESGAVPYYSGWNAIDEFGLNSETIAHEGISSQFIEEYDPNVIMLVVPFNQAPIRGKSEAIAGALDDSDYRLVAAIPRQRPSGTVAGDATHLYFVDTDQAGHQEISCALLTVDDVRYTERESYAYVADIDTTTANVSRSDC